VQSYLDTEESAQIDLCVHTPPLLALALACPFGDSERRAIQGNWRSN
jgi:hypothetical protein